ncbi:MAG: DsrE family protein [Marinomonas colpomeniae]
MKNTLIHLNSSPYSSLSCKEGLDLALVLATFEQAVDLCLSGAALSILGTNQNPEAEQGRNLHKLLEGLEFYDIENIFIQEPHLNSNTEHTWQGTQALNETEWNQMFSNYQQVFRF